MSTQTPTRTAVSTHVAAEGSAIPFNHLERMAGALAKSGMFAAKTPEGALSLLLIAQAEGIPPAQAMMDYDVIQGKPALKSAAMLARFQRSGGKIRWITRTDDVCSAEFSHPSGGALTVTWDNERCRKAGLLDKEMHKKFGAQMKGARVISEGIRAVAPQCIPINMYTVEETQDIVDVTPAPTHQADAEKFPDIEHTGLSAADLAEHTTAIAAAADEHALKEAFNAAWVHAKAANDEPAKARLKAAYDNRKGMLTGGAL